MRFFLDRYLRLLLLGLVTFFIYYYKDTFIHSTQHAIMATEQKVETLMLHLNKIYNLTPRHNKILLNFEEDLRRFKNQYSL